MKHIFFVMWFFLLNHNVFAKECFYQELKLSSLTSNVGIYNVSRLISIEILFEPFSTYDFLYLLAMRVSEHSAHSIRS